MIDPNLLRMAAAREIRVLDNDERVMLGDREVVYRPPPRIYVPQPGSTPDRCIKALAALPPGTRVSSHELARLAGVRQDSLGLLMARSIEAGLVRYELAHRSKALWSLPVSA